MSSLAFQPFSLPNGTVLQNRIAKAAMEEKMADVGNHNQPSSELVKLYKMWGQGGAGLILSGHIMIDPMAMACPGDVLLADDAGHLDEARWRQWIQETQKDGAQFWLQINHPGRQIRNGTGLPVYAPSAVALQMGSISKMFQTPIAMSEDHIQDVIRRFAWTAQKAEYFGASGVEIHAAHGYLISQFLSPLSNQRTDKWGGSLENRARLLFEVVRTIRSLVSHHFGVGVKINTADFQRGGFNNDDLYWIIGRLNEYQIDLVEISGGNFESPVMLTGVTSTNRTAQRDAYFLDVAKKINPIAEMGIIVTGGIACRKTLEDVLSTSDRFIAGIGTALGLIPDLPNRWRLGHDPAPSLSRSWILPNNLQAAAKTSSVQLNLRFTGCGWQLWKYVWPTMALLLVSIIEECQLRTYKRLISHRALTANLRSQCLA